MNDIKYPSKQAVLSGNNANSGFGGALTVPEFCRRYSIGRSSAYTERKEGRLNFRKVGSRSLILLGEAERWAASLPEAVK